MRRLCAALLNTNNVVTAAGSTRRVSSMAAVAVPETNGGEYVVQELSVGELKSKEFTTLPTETNCWIKSSKIWLQPEGEDESTPCQTCEEGHSHLTPCSNVGQPSLLGNQMARALAASAVDPDNPFRWVSHSSQQHDFSDVQSMSVLTSATRVRNPPIFVDRLARQRFKDTRFCIDFVSISKRTQQAKNK